MAVLEDGLVVGEQTPLPATAAELFEYIRHEPAFMTGDQLQAYRDDGSLTRPGRNLTVEFEYLVRDRQIVLVGEAATFKAMAGADVPSSFTERMKAARKAKKAQEEA